MTVGQSFPCLNGSWQNSPIIRPRAKSWRDGSSKMLKQIDSVLVRLSDNEFKNLTRSTIPLVCYWKDDSQNKAAALLQSIGMEQFDKPTFEFAPEVAAIPNARPSETDLMITQSGMAVAIEAKWSEPRYETVNIWKRKTARWSESLNHWFQIIQPFSDAPSPPDSDTLVYQMIHRCASACHRAGPNGIAAMVYQVFVDGSHKRDFYAGDLQEFCRLIKPKSNLRIALQAVPLSANSEYRLLSDSLPDNPECRPTIIRRAIKDRVLFDFGEPALTLFH